MYSPGRGDARATLPPNARDSSTSMPIDPASAWHREPYNRDVRLDRGDRDRIIGGKRDWDSGRSSSGSPYQRAYAGIHPVNGSLGPPNKRRLNGRHSGFHTENGRYGSVGHRGEPSPFTSIPPLENGLARKFDRDFYPGSGCAVANTGFSNGPGLDHRSKDSDERHKRESFPVSGDVRDGGSSVVNDQPVRPYHSQVLSEVENSSWERDRSKGLISSGSWDSSQRSERDHRERLSGKPDSYSRREGKFSQYDAGRDWSQGDRDLDGSRLDRYGSSSRDGFSSDTLGGTKDPILGFDWRRKERSSSVSAPRTSPYIPSNGGTKETLVRPQGLDVSGSAPSPQHSPHSTPSSTVHEPSRDDGNHPSPPKRPRLGWGQGLAKYEKKKVVETDEVATPSPGVTVSENGRSIISAALSGTTTETLLTQDIHAAEESPVSVVSNPTISPALTPSTSPLQQALENVSKSTVDSQVAEPDAVGKLNEKVEDEAEKPVVCSNLPCVVAENVVKKSDVCGVTESTYEVIARQPDSSESVDKPNVGKELSEFQASPFSPSLIEQSSAVDLIQEVSSSGDVAGWTKEAILLRVEKVESEIEQVERELSRLEKVENSKNVANTEPVENKVVEDVVMKSEHEDDGPQAMDEDDMELSAPTRDSRDSSQLVNGASPIRNFSLATECISKCSGEEAIGNVVHKLGANSVEVEDVSTVDQVAVLEEGELHEEKQEQVISRQLLHDSESERSLISSPGSDMDLTSDEQMNQLIIVSKSEIEDKEESNTRVVLRDYQVGASTLMEENKRQAHQASRSFAHLLTQDLSQGVKLYSCPVEAPVWKENVESHDRNQERMLEKLTERKQSLKFTERILTMRFRAFKDAWRQEQLGVSQQQRGTKPVRRWELEKRNGTSLPCQRSSLRLRPVQPGMGKMEVVSEEHMKRLMVEPVVGQLRHILKMPAMILGDKERLARRFENKNALVEDPVRVDMERRSINPWTAEEKKMFLEKFALYNKNFSKIASHLEYKTTADCVEFYYRNQKSEDFEKIRRRQQLKKRRDYSRVGGSYLATSLPTNSRQREANAHARAEALNGQTAAAVVAVTHISVGAKAVRSSIHHKPPDRVRMSSSLDPASLPPALELGKSVSGKENKFSVTLPVPPSATVPAAAIATGSPPVTISCGLSSAIPPPVKISRERSSVKTMSNGGLVVSRSGSLEQHASGPKGARSIHIRRDLAKSAGEEADAQWTDRERELFTEAVAMFGKDFQKIADHVSTKNLGQCKSFFSKTRKRLGLDHLVEKYQAKLKASAEAALMKNLDCVDVKMEEVLPAVSEDVLPISMKVDAVPMPVPMEEENHGKKSPEHDDNYDHEEHDEHDELEEEIANALKLSDSKATEEEASEPASTLVLSKDVTIETSVCLTVSPVVEGVVKVECEVAAAASTVDECRVEEPVDLTPAVVKPESVHKEEPVISQVSKVEEADEMPAGSDSTSLAASGVLEEEDGPEAPKGAESVDSPKCEIEAGADNDIAALDKTPNLIQDQQEPRLVSTVTVKPEPGSPQVAMSASTDSASFPSVTAALSHSAIFSTTSSIQNAQQVRERVGRVGSSETKPRREPTSWTQEEKEKFADIIRNHGKDWNRLQDCLPAKSLTQIKTYFQNSKAKLGLLNPEGLNISGGRGAGSRKRKADDSDTSSNNVGSLTTANEFKSGSVLPSDVDVASQKVSPSMAALPSMTATMSLGTNPVGTENLAYSLFGQRMEDPMTVQKFIRQMCSNANGFAQNPQAIYPFLHQHPMFSNPGLQRAPHSNLQQQLAASLSQKSSQSIGLQPPLQSGGVQQSSQPNLHQQAAHQLQTAQVARSQQQLLQSMMQQQAAVHLQQQQHQTHKNVLHPLQQQVVVLQQGQAAQRQQQQQLLNQQVVHHPQAQQASGQQQQASSTQQIGNQSLAVGSSPQVTNQLKQLHHQQTLFQQQHQFQQAVQHLQQQQQQQLQHHQQEHAQVQAQAQTQAQVQAQAHGHIHQHAPLLQPPVATKPKGLVTLPQQLTKTLSTPVLQQGGLLHRHDQLQHGPALALLRGNVQSAVSNNSGEASNHQEEIGEHRGINSNGASKRREFPRASIEQQLSAAVQRVNPSQQQSLPQRPTPTPATESQQARPGDVKLFGQSLLCQPTSSAATQTAGRLPVSSADRVSVQQSPVYTTSSSPVTSMSVPSATAPKVYGKESAFRGVPFMPDGRQAAWSPLANPWNIMNGMHSQGSPVSKGSEGESEHHNMQETRMSREARDGESEQTMPSLTHKIQHLEHPRIIQDHPRIDGLSTMVHGLEKPRASVNDQGGGAASLVSAADISRSESDRRADNIAHTSSGTDRGSMTASRTSRGQPESFPVQTAGPLANSQQVPRNVINALMAIADWHQSRNLQSHSGIGQPRPEDHQWENLVRQGLAAAAANGAAVDALKASPTLGLAASLPAPQLHLGGNELLQQCVRDGGMYFTPQHYPNLAGHTGVSSSAWNSGPGLVHPSEVQRMLVNPALTSFLPGALSRAPTATEEHLGSTESRDPDSGGGGVG